MTANRWFIGKAAQGLGIGAALVALAMWANPAAIADQQPEADGTTIIDGLMWAVNSNGEDVPWNEADEYCEALDLAGHTDWRLPTQDEVESVYDPASENAVKISSPLVLEGCCLWSSTTLAQRPPEQGGQSADLANYAWGYLFEGGIRYYSVMFFPDGQAQCVRQPDDS